MDILDIKKMLDDEDSMKKLEVLLPDDESINNLSFIYRALSDPIRLKIMYLLHQHTLCVCLVKRVVDISDSKLSYHLSILRKAGLIEGSKNYNWIIYSVTEKGKEYVLQLDKKN